MQIECHRDAWPELHETSENRGPKLGERRSGERNGENESRELNVCQRVGTALRDRAAASFK